MKTIKFFPFFLALIMLAGCGGGSSSGASAENESEAASVDGPENNDPESNDPESNEPEPTITIGTINTDIWHQHTSFDTKWDNTPVRTVRFAIQADVSDLAGIENLSDLYIHNAESELSLYLLGGADNEPLEKCYFEAQETFECVLFFEESLDRIDLKSWELVAQNSQGQTLSKPFEFSLPGGETAGDVNFVYSSSYSGPIDNGQPALEVITIENNEMVFSANIATQSFHIEFEVTDSRASEYSLVFYELINSESGLVVGGTNAIAVDTATILDNPIIQGHKTVLDLPWSEITFAEGEQANNIFGMHVIVKDEPVELLETGTIWNHHTSISEYIPLELSGE